MLLEELLSTYRTHRYKHREVLEFPSYANDADEHVSEMGSKIEVFTSSDQSSDENNE